MDSFYCLDEIQQYVLSSILKFGDRVSTRGMSTLEIFPFSFVLENPRMRCISNPARLWNFPLAIGEFCWHLSGSKDLRFIQYYARRWKDFSDDGLTIRGSCYGNKIFSTDEQPNKWQKLINLLKQDPHSRRAVLALLDNYLSLSLDSKDISCTSTIQFLIRQNKLHAIVNMRSNDAIWGLPYDVFLFTMIQEKLASELSIELGTYTHIAGSMHVYERHLDLANKIISYKDYSPIEMPCMNPHQQLIEFLKFELKIREENCLHPESKLLSPYWLDLLEVLNWHRSSKERGGFFQAYDLIPANQYYTLLCNMSSGIEKKKYSASLNLV
jgi:thymidylate synthase